MKIDNREIFAHHSVLSSLVGDELLKMLDTFRLLNGGKHYDLPKCKV
jgi:hypothetical protein